MRFLSIILWIILITIYTNSNTNAQIAGEVVYSLDDCIDIAISKNPEVLITQARAEASTAEVTSAFGDFLPTISVNSGYSRQLNAKPSFGLLEGQLVAINPNPNSYSMSIGAQLLIFDGFARGNNYRSAHENVIAAEYSANHAVSRVKLYVLQDYTDVIAKYQIVKVRRENLELGRKELERIQAQNKAGLIAVNILYSQEADLGNNEFDLVTAENSLNIAKAKLLTTMGLTPDIQAEFLESSLPSSVSQEEIRNFRKTTGNYKDAIRDVLSHRLDYLASKSTIVATESSVTTAQSGYYPRVSASGGWNWSNIELNKFTDLGRSSVGLNLYIPIFDNFNTNARIQNAKLQLEQRKLEQFQLEQNIKTAINTAFLNLDASEKQLEISDRALKSSEMNQESAKERFRVGSASITDYLTANTQLITSQINRINAVYRYFQSQKEVLYAIGKLE